MSEGTKTARGKVTVVGGTYTNHVDHNLAESERKLTVYNLERERSDVWLNILNACANEGKRQVLTTLYINEGVCTYKDLDDTVNRHIQTLKKHVYHLEDQGIVRKSGNPAIVSFKDTDIALLVSDALNTTDPL